jgi:hypothetical protein
LSGFFNLWIAGLQSHSIRDEKGTGITVP